MKFYETEDFKKQQKEWYQRLKDSGFKDAETMVDDRFELVTRSKRRCMLESDKICYYQALTHGVSTQPFDCDIDFIVLFMRADGINIKTISEELKARGLQKSHRETIRYIIRKYEMRWGIKKYKPSQLSSKERQWKMK